MIISTKIEHLIQFVQHKIKRRDEGLRIRCPCVNCLN